MHHKRRIRKLGALLSVVGILIVLPRASGAIILHQSGYSATLLVDLPRGPVYGDLEVDQVGDIYVSSVGGGISKVSGSTVIPWSSVDVLDLTLILAGGGYGSGGSACHCISSIQANGSFSTLHADSHTWRYLALTTDEKLYASVTSIVGQGLYELDRSTGVPSPVISGGPGPGGIGVYRGMAGGSDGALFTLGTLDGTLSGHRLFRLDGTQFTEVATLPNGGIGLSLGPSGMFYVSTAFTVAGGFPAGELWIVDPIVGLSTRLASNGSYPGLSNPGFNGVAYNAATGTIYVLEEHKLWAIARDTTPAESKSWGAVKALYRGERKSE